MSQSSKHFMNQKVDAKVFNVFLEAIKNNKSTDNLIDFLNDLLSNAEKSMLSKRVAVAFMLLENKYTYEEIGKTLKVSRGTTAKIHAVIAAQGTGYKKTLGNLILKKMIRNSLKEFLEFLRPKRRTLTGEVYNKPHFDLKKEINEPL